MWFFNSPRIVFGEDALCWLEQIKGNRAFIVTDQTIAKLGYLELVEKHLSQANINCHSFTKVEPDPCLETVMHCAEEIRKFNPDWVVGLGGGSCMDAAKAAWFLYERPDVELESVNPMEDYDLRAKARLIAIPTTAGSGAEATAGTVILDCQMNRKLEIVTFEIMPDMAIIDPIFSGQMPRQLTADVGIDVLTHAIEAFSCSWPNDFSDALSIQAAKIIFEFLPIAVKNGSSNKLAREKIANAATLAGMAINTSHIALAHAMGHSSGVIFHLPHGRTTGLCLPYTIEFTTLGGAGRYLELVRSLGIEAVNEEIAGIKLGQAVRNLLGEINQPQSFCDAGVNKNIFYSNLEILCDHAQMDSSIATSRRTPSIGEIHRLFEYAYHGKVVDF
jgi:alcohol dehydrogenase class IV